MHAKPTIYAIDFGTSNSLLGAANQDTVFEPISLTPSASDPTILRSVLYFGPETRGIVFGEEAVAAYIEAGMEGRLIRSFKKHLASRSFNATSLGGRRVTLEELVGTFLHEMRRRANAHFGADVDRVLLGRPARFSMNDDDDALAQGRLERAARLAGFNAVSFCPEPVAAAGSFPEDLRAGRHTVLVADLGGGTSDFTVIRMTDGVYERNDILALGGVSTAGDALDGSLMRYRISRHFGSEVTFRYPGGANVLTMPRAVIEALCSPADLTLLADRKMMAFIEQVRSFSLGDENQQLVDALVVLVEDALGFPIFEAIEHTKRDLSAANEATFEFRYAPIDIEETIHRDELDAASVEERGRILRMLEDTVETAGTGFDGIDVVCCTGGTARVPAIADAIAARFPDRPVVNLKQFHSVIGGLAVRARDEVRTAPLRDPNETEAPGHLRQTQGRD